MRAIKSFRLPACLLLIILLLLASGPSLAGDPLPSWRGPVRTLLLDFIREATTAGGENFIPPARRIAAFDLDGTLISERPYHWIVDISLYWLQENCAEFAKQGEVQAGLCRAAAQGDKKYLYDNIEALLSLPFEGMDLDAYRAYALKVFETDLNPKKKLPLSKLVYRPQLELIDLLHQKGFTVYACSGTSIVPMQAISQKYLHIPPSRCIGTRFVYKVSEANGRLLYKRGAVMPSLLNLGKVKAVNLKLATATGPVLAFGNTMGDSWMLRYAASARPQGLALLLDHDDPREFVYAKPDVLALAKERGWQVVSMKRDWARVFK
jgi:phosphoserine phosphatase